jgi:hypothetical protein
VPGCSTVFTAPPDRVHHLADLIKLSCNAIIPFNIEMGNFPI